MCYVKPEKEELELNICISGFLLAIIYLLHPSLIPDLIPFPEEVSKIFSFPLESCLSSNTYTGDVSELVEKGSKDWEYQDEYYVSLSDVLIEHKNDIERKAIGIVLVLIGSHWTSDALLITGLASLVFCNRTILIRNG